MVDQPVIMYLIDCWFVGRLTNRIHLTRPIFQLMDHRAVNQVISA
jgi:hypothetical protein